jgi:HTH-type transcriptional regulator/antitoxin HigA
MITNEKEYVAAKSALARFQRALAEFDTVREIEIGVDPKIARAQKDSFAFQVDQLGGEIRRYEILKSGVPTCIEVNGIEGIGRALVQARIARALSQKKLADLVGVQEQQIQRYERDFYRSASLKRLGQIFQALGSKFEGVIDPGDVASENSPLMYGIPIENFPFSEAKRERWFGPNLTKTRFDEDDKKKLLWKFFAESPAVSGEVLHRKTAGTVGLKRRAAVIMWQAQVLRRAESLSSSYPRFHPLDSRALKKFVSLSVNEDSFEEAHEILKDHGIILVCQKHLKSTKLDGAALALRGKHAVLALTLRHNRLDNLWFNLLHELGHLTRHWDKVLNRGIVDEDTGVESTELFEREADEFARNAIVPDDAWNSSMVRYATDPSTISKFAKRFEVHPALIAGRVRHERGFATFNELVGHGAPRRLMESLGLWSEEDELV